MSDQTDIDATLQRLMTAVVANSQRTRALAEERDRLRTNIDTLARESGARIRMLEGDVAALKRAIREAKADRDGLRNVLAKLLPHVPDSAAGLRQRAEAILANHPYEGDDGDDGGGDAPG